MIASEEPCVRQPVVSPGALKRSASIRTQRCSISAEIGYSAWSMKLRCRFSAMIRCASGSIHVVTKVARLRCGSPSMVRSTSTRRIASTGAMPVSGKCLEGADSVRNRLPKRAAARSAALVVMLASQAPSGAAVLTPFGLVRPRRGSLEELEDPTHREAHRPGEGPPVDQPLVHHRGRGRPRERGEPGQEEQDRADLVDADDPPAEVVDDPPDAPVPDLDERQVSRDQEADAADDVRQPDPAVALARGELLGVRRDQ